KCVSNLQLPDASIRTIEHHQVAVVDVRIGSIRSKPFVGASFACPAIGVEELRLVGRAAVCSVEAHQDFISSLTLHEAKKVESFVCKTQSCAISNRRMRASDEGHVGGRNQSVSIHINHDRIS